MDDHHDWAVRLETARTGRHPLPPLTEALPGLSVEDAYAIARHGIDRRLAGGTTLVGHKIGLTSVAVQTQLGVDQPDFGALLADMEIADGGTVDAGALIAPRVELELAFWLSSDVPGPRATVEDVRAATEAVQPAIEIVDSRIADWRIALVDTIADNASSGAFVLGGRRVPLDDVDVTEVEARLTRNGSLSETGRSDAVLGDPRTAVAWLANALHGFGTTLRAGQVVLSGACTRMVDAGPGDVFVGDFGALGSVSVSFERR